MTRKAVPVFPGVLFAVALFSPAIIQAQGPTGSSAREIPTEVQKNEPRVDQIIERANDHFRKGKLNLEDNKREQARDEFDKAVDTILMSGMDVRSSQRLQTYYLELVERIYREEVPLTVLADHIDHIRSVAGIDHIGIGSDFDGMPPGPDGLEGPELTAGDLCTRHPLTVTPDDPVFRAVRRMASLDVGTRLDLEGVAVRTGHHCCQPLMARYGIPGTVRASLALYNTTLDVDRFVEALRRTVKGASPRSRVTVPAPAAVAVPKHVEPASGPAFVSRAPTDSVPYSFIHHLRRAYVRRRADPSFRAELDGRQLLLRVDRSDLSKNILRGLHAYELLLERHPEHRDAVWHYAHINPSRQSVPEYRAYLDAWGLLPTPEQLQAFAADVRNTWWPAIPGGILSAVGGALLIGSHVHGLDALDDPQIDDADRHLRIGNRAKHVENVVPREHWLSVARLHHEAPGSSRYTSHISSSSSGKAGVWTPRRPPRPLPPEPPAASSGSAPRCR